MTIVGSYGGEIEADLHHYYGVDLIDFFRGKHAWRKLVRLIRRLPAESEFRVALALDKELAEELLEEEARTGVRPTKPPLSGYTRQEAKLDLIADLLQEILAVDVAKATEKYNRPTPVRRPDTALDIVRREQSQQRRQSLIEQVEAAQQRFREKRAIAESQAITE